VAAAKHKGKKASTKGAPDHFEKMLEGPCPNHAYPVKHPYKDYKLLRKFLSRGSKKGDGKKKPDPPGDDLEEKDDALSEETGCLMIFGRPPTFDSKHRRKLARREVYAAELATPAFLRWSRSAITFNRSNNPDNILHLGQYPLIVDPIIDKKHLSKVLMDGGSDLNIMYVKTIDAIGIHWSCIRPTEAPFYGIMLGKHAKPLRRIGLSSSRISPTLGLKPSHSRWSISTEPTTPS
jgi:hypothetical protein